MLRSRQSDAANFMDIGRISAAIKRKVIELVEKGLSSGAAVGGEGGLGKGNAAGEG